MICINDDIMIMNRVDLSSYIDLVEQQRTDEVSGKVVDGIISYLIDVWERSEKVTELMQKYTNTDIVPICYVDLHDTADYTQLKVAACSPSGTEPKEKDLVAFDQFCEKHFSSIKSLYNIFCAIDE